jgi:hypothetical protein
VISVGYGYSENRMTRGKDVKNMEFMVQITSEARSKRPRKIDGVFLLTPLGGSDSFRRKFARQHREFKRGGTGISEAGLTGESETLSEAASLHDQVDCAELLCAPLLNCDTTSYRSLDRGEV